MEATSELAVTKRLARFRYWIFACAALLMVLGIAGLQRVTYDPHVLTYFDPRSPELRDFLAVEDRFGRSNEMVFLVISRTGLVLDESGLRAVRMIEERVRSIPTVTAVRSVLDLVESAPDAAPVGTAELSRRLEIIETAAPETVRGFISDDRTVTAVAAFVPRSARGDVDVAALAEQARAAASEVKAQLSGVDVMLTGRIIIDDAFQNEGRNDLTGPAGLSFLITTAILALTLGSLAATAALMAVVMVSTVVTTGVLGWLGIPLNGISSAAPSVLLGLAVATGVHIVLAWQDALRAGNSREAALDDALRWNGWPVTLSVITTIVSFLCLNLMTSPPFQQLGNVVAAGLVFTLALCFTLLPALLLTIPANPARGRVRFENAMGTLGRFVSARRGPLLLLCALTTLAAGFGVSRVTYDDTFSHYFDERYEIRRATDLFEEKLTGTTILSAVIPAPRPGEARDAAFLGRIEQLAGWLRAKDGVARVVTPGRGDAANPGARLVDERADSVRLEIVLKGVSSADTLALASEVEDYATSRFGPEVIVTGIPILSAQLSIDSAQTMLIATAIALAAVSVILVIAVQSLGLGLASIVPNLLPMLIAFGLWGVLVGEVSFAATVVATLTFGVVVDDTVHILMKYRGARRAGMHPQDAVVFSFRTVGVAVAVTTVAIGAGFATFGTSGFLVNQHFGILSALTLGAALIADLLFLPPLLLLVDSARRRQGQR